MNGTPASSAFPANLQGWSTFNTEDANTWANFKPRRRRVSRSRVSFRGACDTSLPNPNTKILTLAAPCFEDTGFTTVNQLCNQGSTTQIVNCYYANGAWPSETRSVRASTSSVGIRPRDRLEMPAATAPPESDDGWIHRSSAARTSRTSAARQTATSTRTRTAVQRPAEFKVDLGDVMEDPPGNPGPRADAEGRERRGQVSCSSALTARRSATYGTNCDLQANRPTRQGTVTTRPRASGSSPDLPLTASSRGNAIAIQIRVKGSTVVPNPGNCGPGLNSFNNNCRWFHTGNGQFGTSVEPTERADPRRTRSAVASRARITAGSVQWLRLTTDPNCDGRVPIPDIDRRRGREPADKRARAASSWTWA